MRRADEAFHEDRGAGVERVPLRRRQSWRKMKAGRCIHSESSSKRLHEATKDPFRGESADGRYRVEGPGVLREIAPRPFPTKAYGYCRYYRHLNSEGPA